ncbi:MAG: hypothetical protein P4L93_04355 [Coriobacteriia bacterium]|nr:hypothetical protein [Coriobacteriia bacterium]
MAIRRENAAARTLRVVILGLLIATALAAVGCSASKQSVDPIVDRKAKMETAAKFYVADAARNIEGLKALVYDPTNYMGLATATPPAAGTPTASVTWSWQGADIVMREKSDPATYTISSTEASPSVVTLKDANGQLLDTLFVKKIDNEWRIDAQAIEKAVEAQAKTPEGQKQTCWKNQEDIESAIAAYDADHSKLPKKVADLVPKYLPAVPTCPTTGSGYTLDGTGLVLPCKVHGHYPESEQ